MLQVCQQLVQNGATINLPDVLGMTPLFAACQKGHYNVVKFLYDSGAELNRAANDGTTALHYAVSSNWLDIVKFLVENGANVARKSSKGYTPIDYAPAPSHDEVYNYLIKFMPKPQQPAVQKPTKTLLQAVKDADLQQVILHVDSHSSELDVPDADGKTPLYHAAVLGDAEIVEELIKAGANVNSKSTKGFYPLYVAAEGGFTVCECDF